MGKINRAHKILCAPIKISLIILTLITLVGLISNGVVLAEPLFGTKSFDKANHVQDEIIVKFKGDIEPFKVIKIPEGKVGEKIKEYLERRDVIYAEPNYIAQAFMVPNDPYYRYQWHMDNPVYGGIQTEGAWDISTGSGVTIAIIDTGIAYENYTQGSWWSRIRYYQAPDLAQTCFVSGYDFVNNDSHPNDDHSHGTHVSGTVAQSTNNNLGVTGVAFNACLMPIKVLDRNGSGTYANIANGIRFAADNGAKVINLSLGGPSSSTALEEAIVYAYNKGVIIIAAAGNDGSSTIAYPAAYNDYVIAVGATRYDETLAYYSNYGASLDLVAPGGDLNIDQNNDGYKDGVLQNTFNPNTKNTSSFSYWFFQGTSMAAPHVSGTAALVIAKGIAITPDDVRTVLEETAEDLGVPGRDSTYGWGLVNALVALQWTAGPTCSTNGDCNDGVNCTKDSCIDGECIYAPNDNNCSGDDWIDTGNVRWVSIDQCREKEQKEKEYRDYYCHPTLDCQYNVTDTQWTDTGAERNKADGVACEDGQFCTIGETCQAGACAGGETRTCNDSNSCTIDSCDEVNNVCLNTAVEDNTTCPGGLCCSGTCALPSCLTNSDCNDGNTCTIDNCLNAGTCAAVCSYQNITACVDGDGCCPSGCAYETDNDCSTAVKCWSGDYQYFYRNSSQARKFCKCAQGVYGYNSYGYIFGRNTVYRYTDSGDNENWDVTSRSSYLSVNSVTCSDGVAYPTNQDYYYSK